MRTHRIGTVTGIPVWVNVTLLVFLPVLAWLVARPDQLELYAGLVDTTSPHAVDREARGPTTVADAMEAAPPSVGADADAFDVLRALGESRGDRVLVTEDGRLRGQITSADVVTAIEVLQGLGASRELEVPEGYA